VSERDRGREHNRERTRERELPTQWGVRDLAAVRDVGDFRAIRPRDLAAVHYGGSVDEIDKLVAAGYVRRHWVADPRVKEKNDTEVLGLTSEGRKVLRQQDPDRRIFTTRIRDLAHDADVYPAVAKIRAQIEAEGGRIERIIPGEKLAAERAKMANRPRGEWKRNPPATLKRQQEIATALDLNLVEGRVLIPDARVILRDQNGKQRQIDVEVTTPSYGRAERSAKSRAGFHLTTGVSFTRGRKVFDDHR
jgi:hypothetical protein